MTTDDLAEENADADMELMPDGRRIGFCLPPAIDRSGETVRVVHEFSKNARATFRVTVKHINGFDTAEVRLWYRKANGEETPTDYYLFIKPSLIPELRGGLKKAFQLMRSRAREASDDGQTPRPDWLTARVDN
jgi:hypothetical protein